MIPQIGEVLARVKNVQFETLMETVRKNTRDCYGGVAGVKSLSLLLGKRESRMEKDYPMC